MEAISRDKILFVDDEPRVLEAMNALLHDYFEISTAAGGEEGLRLLRTAGPYAVLVSDFRMPGMDGIEFLSIARQITPDTMRVMLTGYADTDTAIEAVNSGEVFRFHTKPCPASLLRQTLSDSLKKYRSVRAARTAKHALLHTADETRTGEQTGETIRPLWSVLSSKELRVADLIRMNLSSKEIADSMNIATRTVETHRENIRRKLGIANEKVNLQNYLSFQNHR